MSWAQTVVLVAAIIGGAGSVMVAISINVGHIQTQMATYVAEAAADRRAMQESMDRFQKEMRVLGERQARLEGLTTTRARP